MEATPEAQQFLLNDWNAEDEWGLNVKAQQAAAHGRLRWALICCGHCRNTLSRARVFHDSDGAHLQVIDERDIRDSPAAMKGQNVGLRAGPGGAAPVLSHPRRGEHVWRCRRCRPGPRTVSAPHELLLEQLASALASPAKRPRVWVYVDGTATYAGAR